MKRHPIRIFPLFFLLSFLSCGKKGPLELPIIRVPKDVEILALNQRGGNVYLEWKNPAHYIDGNPMPEISRVEIWTLEKERDPESSLDLVSAKDFKKEGNLVITINENDFPEFYKQESPVDPVMQFVFPLENNYLDKQYYFSFRVVDARKRTSDFSVPVSVSPRALPLPPNNVQGEVFEDRIVIRWNAPGKNIDQSEPPLITGYNLFRNRDGMMTRLNSDLIKNPEYEDSDFVFGSTYRYIVRTAASESAPYLESEDSEAFTITPNDIFPPSPPEGLVAVAGSDVLSLIWEVNRESDFKGYRVWRRAEGETDFVVLTPEPIMENAFIDDSVEKNKRYHYAITALDVQGNESRKSSSVSEILKEGSS